MTFQLEQYDQKQISEMIHNGELAVITDIEKFSLTDGPGIRTIPFFKGCPLSCRWCHNPETSAFKPELMQNRDLCIGCRMCIKACKKEALSVGKLGIEIDRRICDCCGDCTKTCYAKALCMSGKYMTLDEVYSKMMEDEPFYRNSGGGVTLSGGECTAQIEFAVNLLKRLKDSGIHTAIETCGYCSWEKFKRLLEYTDLVLFDIKVPDREKSILYTGRDNTLILENLKKTCEMGKDVVARFPMIPGVNDDEVSVRKVAEITVSNNISRLNILPFHQYGSEKWAAIGRSYDMLEIEPPSDEDVQHALEIFLEYGIDASVGGGKA